MSPEVLRRSVFVFFFLTENCKLEFTLSSVPKDIFSELCNVCKTTVDYLLPSVFINKKQYHYTKLQTCCICNNQHTDANTQKKANLATASLWRRDKESKQTKKQKAFPFHSPFCWRTSVKKIYIYKVTLSLDTKIILFSMYTSWECR